jgi:predicted ATPase
MITSLQIENYRCIRALELEIAPLTVLVGANATGKSAIIDAIACMGPNRDIEDRDIWRHTPNFAANVIATMSDRTQSHRRHGGPYGRVANNIVLRVQPLRLELEAVRKPRVVEQPSLSLARNGENLLTVLETLPRRTRESLAVALSALVVPVGDVDTFPDERGGGRKVIKFRDRWNEKLWFRPDEVSDGTILLTAFLTLQHLDPAPDVVTIEEPERGLHPYLLGELVGYLRKLSTGAIGTMKPIQIVMATHSGDLLDHLLPEEVRFLSRTDDGGVRAETIDPSTSEWKAAIKAHDGSLGGVWLSGGLGGVPSH